MGTQFPGCQGNNSAKVERISHAAFFDTRTTAALRYEDGRYVLMVLTDQRLLATRFEVGRTLLGQPGGVRAPGVPWTATSADHVRCLHRKEHHEPVKANRCGAALHGGSRRS